jgi:hypothetical protein
MNFISCHRADQKAETSVEPTHNSKPLLVAYIAVHFIEGVFPVEPLRSRQVEPMFGQVLTTLGFVPCDHLM